MDPYFGSPTHANFPLGLNNSDFYPMRNDQDGHPVIDPFSFGPGVGGELLYGVGLEILSTLVPSVLRGYIPDHHPCTSVMDQLPVVAPHQLSHGSFPVAPSLNSAWDALYGHGVPQTPGHCEFVWNPQFVRVAQSCAVCPTPTSLPSLSSLAIRKDGVHCPDPLPEADEPNQLLLLTCDHTNCYPPSDVGHLSRRFPENENWVRARASAVASLPRMRGGIYSLPIEIVEMILENFPAIDQLARLGAGPAVLQAWDRHKALLVLSATSKRFWQIFCVRSWVTRVTPTMASFQALVGFLKQVEIPFYTLFIERLIVRLPRNSIELLRDCLVGLPSLHTLGIANGSGYIEPQAFKSVSKHRLDFPNIKKVAIPAFAYPILALLPNVEEIVCFSGSVPVRSVTSILRKLRKPYQSARVEPVLKSVKVVCTDLDVGCTKILVGRFPRLRKLCLPEPSERDMIRLRGLKELTELEILVTHKASFSSSPYDIHSITSMAVQLLRASECHKGCVCNRKCGCAKTNECYKCKPPKRILRIRNCLRSGFDVPGITEVSEGELEVIEVSARGIICAKHL